MTLTVRQQLTSVPTARSASTVLDRRIDSFLHEKRSEKTRFGIDLTNVPGQQLASRESVEPGAPLGRGMTRTPKRKGTGEVRPSSTSTDLYRKEVEGNGFQRCAASHDSEGHIPPIVRDVLLSSGQPLDYSIRRFMEPRFGTELSDVRVHTDSRAAESARAVSAHAYSVGNDLVFATGKYDPRTASGRRLLAHELAHVVQQRAASEVGHGISHPGDTSEREADAAANAVVSGRVASIGATRSAIVQRQPDAGSPQAPAPVRMKYLILYDASDVEVKAQAEQTAKDHGTSAHTFEPAKLGELTKREQPDVIMTFGHGIPSSISMGTGLRVFRGQKTITSELEKAGQTKSIHFVAQACSAGAEKGLMDTLQSTPSLKNYTFVSHATGGHVTRNENIRVAGGVTLPVFLAGRFRVELGFDKQSADEIVRQVFVRASDAEAERDAPINTVLREISVLGFEQFWELVKIDHPDVVNDPAVLELNMTEEARVRFAAGIALFRSRMVIAVEQQMKLRSKKSAAASK